jgi:RNA polymerase sigma-70 factor, ECF subfamily
MYAASTLAAEDASRLRLALPAPTVTTPWQARKTRTKGGGPVGGDTGGVVDPNTDFGDDSGDDVVSSTGPMLVQDTAQGKATKAGRAMAEQLFAANYPKLAGWVRRLVDDDDTAHEIASEAFVRLMSRWTKPNNLESPQSYLYMIATNLVRDHWRKMERERRALRTVTSGGDLEPTSDPVQDVDVRQLLMTLPARLREPFLLHYYAGFGVHEIGVLLKRPDGTIKADLYHARAKLRESLEARGTTRTTKGRKGGKARNVS